MRKLVFSILAVLITVLASGCITLVQPDGSTGNTPTAYIDSISPPNPDAGTAITFEGHGTDPNGTIVAYRWRSSVDGDLGTAAKFDAKLSAGNHLIYFMVQDNNGNWSPEVSKAVNVSGGAPPPAPAPASLPVINSFTTNPAEIVSGGSATLAWDVSGASSVSIDEGIGNVSTSGTRVVTPGATTTFTLTASSPGGSVTAGTLVMVSAAPPPPGANKPDLVVTSVNRDGTTIKYTIKNQGTVDAGPSNSRLFIDGAQKATDGVAALAAGASRTESFSYSYECSGTSDTLVVQIDKDNLVDESNEANNSYSTTWTCLLVIIPPIHVFLAKPDLVITDIKRSGDKIVYTIKNQGAFASGDSSSRLTVNGVHKADDTVASLAAGEEREETFSSYSYTGCIQPPITQPIQVEADQFNAVDEGDNEDNNLRTENWFCTP